MGEASSSSRRKHAGDDDGDDDDCFVFIKVATSTIWSPLLLIN